MRSLRSIGPAALAASMVALTLSVSGLAGAPAASASTGACWSGLSLLNGWQSAQNSWNTGDPSYCESNGMVYLSGSLAQPGGGASEVAVLPDGAQPASVTYLSVYTYAGTPGVLQINPDGTMYAYAGKATQFTSLAGVSFPMATAVVQPLTLNGWDSAQSAWGTGDPSYFVSGNAVHLAGSMSEPPNPPYPPDSTFAYLPAAATPTECVATDVYTYGGAVGNMEINDDPFGWVGESSVYPAQIASQFTSLAGVSYPVSGVAYKPLNLINGWTPPGLGVGCQTAGAMYDILDGVVYLGGALWNTTQNGQSAFAVLPPAARPADALYLNVNPGSVLRIDPDGTMQLFSGAAGYDPAHYTSLGGLSYHLGS